MVRSRKEGIVTQEEYNHVINALYEEGSKEVLFDRITSLVERNNEFNRREMEGKKLSRQEEKDLKSKDTSSIRYDELYEILAEFQIKWRCVYLKNIVELFRKSDEDEDGLLTEGEFLDMLLKSGMIQNKEDGIEELMNEIDPNNVKKFTFSQVCKFLSDVSL